MNSKKSDSRYLASLSLFRELYNRKSDIYDVIVEFIKDVIYNNNLLCFTVTDLKREINTSYDFTLIDAVVQTSVNRLKDGLKKKDGMYYVMDKESFRPAHELFQGCNNVLSNTDIIIDGLVKYIEEENRQNLTKSERERVLQSFCAFIIDDSSENDYYEHISSYLISLSNSPEQMKILKAIKEGVVLYTGLIYNTNVSERGSWNTELTIYLDTEILFHFAGYNGELYKVLFDDFFSLVKEINLRSKNKGGKNLIQLRYFEETKNEVDRFFSKAEGMVGKNEVLDPSKTAMVSIVKGCDSEADVVSKRIDFYNLLDLNLIRKEDSHDDYYSNTENYIFNIEDSSIVEIAKDRKLVGVDESLRLINKINIKRRGNSSCGFDNIKHILLSETYSTLALAKFPEIKNERDVPLASNLSFLTNKFWFKLNKGFGTGDYPKTFDVLTKAQLVLSSLVNNAVADKFEEFKRKSSNGELSKEQVIETIATLRQEVKKPEDIDADNIQDVLITISEKSIEKHLREIEILKEQAHNDLQDKIKLTERVNELEDTIQRKNAEENINIDRIQRLENEINSFRQEKEQREVKIRNRISILRRILKFFLVLIFFVTIVLIAIFCELLFKVLSIIVGVLSILNVRKLIGWIKKE